MVEMLANSALQIFGFSDIKRAVFRQKDIESLLGRQPAEIDTCDFQNLNRFGRNYATNNFGFELSSLS